MSNAPKPCTFCGHTTYHYFPNMALPIDTTTKLLGMNAMKHGIGQFFAFTMIACQGCGQIQMFLIDPTAVASQVPGAQTITAQRT